MLSIIIASNRDANFNRISENIAKTVGIAYEVIRITDVKEGLGAAYNEGASLAFYTNLCIVHDDVLFHSGSWGEKVVNHLRDPETGIVGVMGGRYKSAFGLGWRDGRESFYRFNVKDGLENGKLLRFIPEADNKSGVLCLDGAFLCCRKDVWEALKFDSKTFSGFHFYDIDFSFRAAQKYKNFVVGDVLLEHFSHGQLNRAYAESSLRFDRKYEASLPFTLENLLPTEISQLEGYALSEKLRLLKRNRFGLSFRFRLLGLYVKRYRNLYQFFRSIYYGFLMP